MFTSLWHIGGLNFWLRVQTCVIFSKSDDFTWSLFWLIISFEIERKWTFWNRPNRRCRRGFSAVHIWPHEYYSLWQNVRIFSKGLFSFKKTLFFAIFLVKLKLNEVKKHRTAVFSRIFSSVLNLHFSRQVINAAQIVIFTEVHVSKTMSTKISRIFFIVIRFQRFSATLEFHKKRRTLCNKQSS